VCFRRARRRSPWGRSAAERSLETSEQSRERSPVRRRKVRENGAQLSLKHDRGLLDSRSAGSGQLESLSPPVAHIGSPDDQPSPLEPANELGDSRTRDSRPLCEIARDQPLALDGSQAQVLSHRQRWTARGERPLDPARCKRRRRCQSGDEV
jgi:hypothetical protein